MAPNFSMYVWQGGFSLATRLLLQEDDYPEDFEFSEDEGLMPDRPAFTGLFCPSVFKSLLHKAKVVTNIGVVDDLPDQPQGSAAPMRTCL